MNAQPAATTNERKTNGKKFLFKLYVVDDEPNSRQARLNIKKFCERFLGDDYEIEEIDVLQNYEAALRDKVFVTPTLILIAPGPAITILGNLADEGKVLSALQAKEQI